MPQGRASQLYHRLVRVPDEHQPTDDGAHPHLAANGLRQIGAQALQGAGDQIVNAKTVLPWLLTSLGAPAAMIALLVPIRESGSMLPQAAMTSWLQRLPARKWAWVAGAVGQAVATGAIAAIAVLGTGWPAGLGILVALAVLALARAASSLASKDVLGRTVPKGQRGQINGVVTVIAGVVALTVGVGLQLAGSDLGVGLVAVLLAAAALAWLAGAVVYAGVREPREPAAVPPPQQDAAPGWLAQSAALLRGDRTLRRFVVVRSLLLVSALSPPFVVAIGVAESDVGLSGLGLFVLAQGVANLVGGRVFGRLADRSSRALMAWCALLASLVIVGFLAALAVETLRESSWLYTATYLLLALVHLGTRVARKTYVVDVAEGDRRTEYVAVSNSAMGVLLLLAGVLTGALAQWGNEHALVLLAVLGLLGAALGRRLPEVSAGRPAPPPAPG